MKLNERFLQRIDTDDSLWESLVLSVQTAKQDGTKVQTPREVMRTKADRESHSISFELKAGLLRQSHVQFYFCASQNATATVDINDRFVQSFSYASSDDDPSIPPNQLHKMETNVTDWVEGRKSSTMRLLISYPGQKGQAFIPFDRHWRGFEPKLIHKFSLGYFLKSATFFCLIWLALLSIAVIILAQIQILGDSFRFYAVVTTILIWLAGLIGLSDLAKIPVQSGMRRIWSKTRSHENSVTAAGELRWALTRCFMRWRRAFALLLLFLISVPAVFLTGRIVSAMVIRNYYTSLINRAIEGSNQDEYIRRAFVLVPWRKEAQMLFERRAWSLRDPADNNNTFSQYVSDFVKNQDVRTAVEAIKGDRRYPFFLKTDNSSALNDPVLWYASLLPEAEVGDETASRKAAISYLSAADEKTNPEAKIQEASLNMELLQGEQDKTEYNQSAEKLKQLLQSYDSSKNVTLSFPYQIGCDTLASYYLHDSNVSEAKTWYLKVLEARKRQRTLTSDPMWHRPPEKLFLYYMFVSKVPVVGTKDAVDRATGLRDFNPVFKELFEKEFLTSYEEYKKPETWRANTVLDDKVITYLQTTLLNKGWKY